MKKHIDVSRSKIMLWIPMAMMFLAILACSVDEDMSTEAPLSSIDCIPVSFILKGETDIVWIADLLPSTKYQVEVKSDTEAHPINQVQILVMVDETNIADNVNSSIDAGTATTVFTSPEDGKVTIRVSSLIGVFQQDLGEHSIAVCQAE